MSAVIEPIRSLLRKDVEFMWSNPQEKAFNKIKVVLSQQPVLKFFDVKKPVTVRCDASKFGLGAVLTQDDCIICIKINDRGRNSVCSNRERTTLSSIC